MDADLFKPIGERWVKQDGLLAVEYGQGWVYSRVVGRGLKVYKHYSGVGIIDVSVARNVAEASLSVTIGGQTSSVLKLDTTKPLIYHGSIGLFPSHIQAIVRQPAGKTALGKFQNIPTEVAFTSSTSTRYYTFDGEMSTYERPTEAAELIIPPQMEVGFEWYDPGQYDAEPTLKLMFMLYKLQIFKPNKTQRTWENLMCKLMAQRRVPSEFRTCGDIEDPADLPETTMKAWDVTPISLDEATKLPTTQKIGGGM